jgi:hypothetical protein
MAKLVLTNSNVTLGGTDISAYVASVTLSISVNEVETTSFGSGGAVTRVGGLQDNSVTLDMHQDYSAIEGLVYPLIGSTTSLVIKPNGTAVGTANPSYSMTPLIVEWTAVNGAVGELATASVTWAVSGTVTKAVA